MTLLSGNPDGFAFVSLTATFLKNICLDLNKRTRVAEIRRVLGIGITIVTGMSRVSHEGCQLLLFTLLPQLADM